eukprot:8120791-Pyramimonas_sp.AAC.1
MEAKNDLLLLGSADRRVVHLAANLGEVEARLDVIRQLHYLRVCVRFQCPGTCFPCQSLPGRSWLWMCGRRRRIGCASAGSGAGAGGSASTGPAGGAGCAAAAAGQAAASAPGAGTPPGGTDADPPARRGADLVSSMLAPLERPANEVRLAPADVLHVRADVMPNRVVSDMRRNVHEQGQAG